MTAYYNEIDPYAAAWLRNLIAAGHIASGYVDERDIRDVRPADLDGYTQCHFFAGIGVWSHALRLAGWPDDRPVWTGSCPCQPFSAAGRGGGFADERHLWPHWFHLIRECGPATVFGEQVASRDGLGWLDLVHADLEGAGYAVGAADLCAAGVGAPHIRQRLWWVADSESGQFARLLQEPRGESGAGGEGKPPGRRRDAGGMADVRGPGLEGGDPRAVGLECEAAERGGAVGGMAHHHPARLGGQPGLRLQRPDVHDPDGRGPLGGFWAAADWLPCRDGKLRPVEPGAFPLAHGAPARVGRLRAYGNAIVTEAAATFIRAADGHLRMTISDLQTYDGQGVFG